MKYPHMWANWRPGIIIPVFFLSFFSANYGQANYPDARSIAIGNISSISGTILFPSSNPASLAWVSEKSLGAAHISPFFIKEIGISTIESILPAFPGTFRLHISNYGLKGYRNFNWETSYGMKLGENLSAGVSFLFNNTASNGDWNYLWTLGIAGGIQYKLWENSILGLHILNPFSIGNYSSYGPLLPACISLGLSHIIYEDTRILTELSQSTTGFQSKFGLEYLINPELILRVGYHNFPHTISFGSGYRYEKFSIDMAFSWSITPGFSPAIQIQYFL